MPNYEEFSYKHKKYINDALTNKFNVAEGAVRSGKTIDNCIIFAMLLEISPDKIHLASGSTLPNAKLNIGECNGFGLEHIFKGFCRWGKFKDNEALYIKLPGQEEKIVIFAGGGKADSYKKILGNSYGLWIATEINEHYDSEDSKTSFIKVAMARQIASQMPKIIWDLNPSDPTAPIYKWYIDKWLDGIVGGYNYQHFTINDNKSISEERRLEIESQYDKGSVWYLRDILGQRVVASGLIYQEFKDYHIIPMKDWNDTNSLKNSIKFISIGVDFGGSISAHSFVATAILNNFQGAVVIKQVRIPDRIDDVKLTSAFIEFIDSIRKEYKQPIIDIRCDSAEQTLIAGFQRAFIENNIGLPINNAIKGKILNRIRFDCKMFSTNKLHILECCEPLITALRTSIWEQGKNDVRLDNGILDIDSLDSFEYSLEPYMEALIRL